MKHLLTVSLCSMALAIWSLPGQAQVSPAPEHRMPADSAGNAAQAGITGNDGSEAGSDGADSRSDAVDTREDHERKPKQDPVGDQTDFSGNEGADQSTDGSSATPGTGHGSTGLESGTTTDGSANSEKGD